MKFRIKLFSGGSDTWEYRHEPLYMRAVAAMYWHILLVLILCAAVGAIFFGIQAMSTVSRALTNVPSTATPQTPTLNESQLQATLDAFSTRAVHYQLLASSTAAVIPDPSK